MLPDARRQRGSETKNGGCVGVGTWVEDDPVERIEKECETRWGEGRANSRNRGIGEKQTPSGIGAVIASPSSQGRLASDCDGCGTKPQARRKDRGRGEGAPQERLSADGWVREFGKRTWRPWAQEMGGTIPREGGENGGGKGEIQAQTYSSGLAQVRCRGNEIG